MCNFDGDFDGDDFMEDDCFGEPPIDDLDEPTEPDEIEGGHSESGRLWRPDWMDIAILGGLAEEITEERRQQRRRKTRRRF